MRDRVEALLGGRRAAMWVMTFHAACGRILRREAPRLGLPARTSRSTTRPTRCASSRRSLEELELGPEALRRRAACTRTSPNAKNQLVGPDEFRAARRRLLRPDRRRASTTRYQKRLHAVERDGLRRPAHAAPSSCSRRFPERARAVAEGASATSSSTSTRTRTTRSTGSRAAARRRAREHLRRRRPRPVDLRLARRRHPQHPRLRARLPRTRVVRARAELPLARSTILDAANAVIAQQPRPQAEAPLERRSATASRCAWSRSRTSTTRRATSSREIARAASSTGARRRRSPSSTAPTRSRACWRTCCVRAGRPVPGRSAARSSTSAPR